VLKINEPFDKKVFWRRIYKVPCHLKGGATMVYRPSGWWKEGIGYVLLGFMIAIYWLWFTAARVKTFVEGRKRKAQTSHNLYFPDPPPQKEVEKPDNVLPFERPGTH